MTVNVILADILDRDAAGTEAEQLLAALVDHGVFVPVRENGSVLFFRGEDGTPALPGYTSEACCAERLPEAAAAIHCDALRLLDIVEAAIKQRVNGKKGDEKAHNGRGQVDIRQMSKALDRVDRWHQVEGTGLVRIMNASADFIRQATESLKLIQRRVDDNHEEICEVRRLVSTRGKGS